jgi:hypothetical protein
VGAREQHLDAAAFEVRDRFPVPGLRLGPAGQQGARPRADAQRQVGAARHGSLEELTQRSAPMSYSPRRAAA